MDKRKQIIGLGEILWDLLPDGKMLGGAPANFAYHCHVLGANAHIISAVGTDALGKEILEQLENMNLTTENINRDDKRPTGTVTVRLNPDGHPSYRIHEKVAWDFLTTRERTTALVASADAVCFGTLAQRSAVSKKTINYYLANTKPDCLRVFDINLRQDYYSKNLVEDSLAYASILKLNDDELDVLTEMFFLKNSETEKLYSLIESFNLKMIALTKGEGGSLLVTPDQESVYKSANALVADTVGAGDSFTAALVTGLLSGMELESLHQLASELAAFVCTKKGGTPELPDEFIYEFNRNKL